MIITGDNHVWGGIEANKPELAKDGLRQFNSLCDLARAGDKRLVVAGDLFNRSASLGITEYRDQVIKAMSGLEVWFIQGNHDHAGYSEGKVNPPWLPSTGPFHWLGAQPSLIGDLTVSGLDYQRGRDNFLKAWAEVPSGLDVLVVHQAYKGFLPFDGAWEICDEDIAEKAPKVLVIGHVHRPYCATLDCGTTVVSPGSTVWQTYHAPATKVANGVRHYDGQLTYFELPVEKGAQPTQRQFAGRQIYWIDLDVADKAGFAEQVATCKALPAEQQPYFLVEYEPVAGALAAVQAQLNGVPHSAFAKSTEKLALSEVQTDGYGAKRDAASIVAAHVDREAEPLVYACCLDVLQHSDATPEQLGEMLDSYLSKIE